jgi:phospholipase C
MKSTRHFPNVSGSSVQPSAITRRRFIRRAAGASAGLALSPLAMRTVLAARNKTLPKPQNSGIEHIIVVMMENRSFDHFAGWIPGANGQQAGLSFLDANGVVHPTMPLGSEYQGCMHPDPDHSYEGGRIEFDNGACDGWLLAGNNDDYAIGYYTGDQLPFHMGAAQSWTSFDNYFSAIMAGTYPNRIYQHAAQTDRLDDSVTLSSLPTIWDSLADHSLAARYYFSDTPFTALWGTKYLGISRRITQFFDDCQAGTLPAVSFVDPKFVGELQGITNDDHPHADIRNGQDFLNTVYQAVTSSPAWRHTVLIINYDEWGGFFDHVPPQLAPIPPADQALGSDGRRGFRVPAFVISPWSKRGVVDHGLYDHTSILKMIEWRWHLDPLTVRDQTANNIAEALDFSRPNFAAPTFAVPSGPFGGPCFTTPVLDEFTALSELATELGFNL